MKQRLPKPLFTILVIVLSSVILVSTVPPRTLGQITNAYLRNSLYYVEGHLKNGDILPSSPQLPNPVTSVTPIETVWEMLTEVDRDRAEDDLLRLTGEVPLCISSGCYTLTHRFTGSEELQWAMDYVYENLESLGYTVRFEEWSNDKNLIATKTGVISPTEEIYLVSHLDGAKRSDDRYPAADDNAGSVVNGLELARVFSDRDFARTLVIFFSTGEEQGARGVREYLDSLSSIELARIKYVINRDMTGYDANSDGLMNLAHGDHAPSLALAQEMSEIIDAYQLNLDQQLVPGCP